MGTALMCAFSGGTGTPFRPHSPSNTEMREKARLTLVSPMTISEGGAHDVLMKETMKRTGK